LAHDASEKNDDQDYYEDEGADTDVHEFPFFRSQVSDPPDTPELYLSIIYGPD
jgi:hypothetical protein